MNDSPEAIKVLRGYEIISNCLLCNGFLEEVISFGKTPLANELLTIEESKDLSCDKFDQFELTLMKCNDCGHCQLNTLVDEDRMYKHYLYVSGTNSTNIKHFRDYANKILQKFYPRSSNMRVNEVENTILEIASNDGTFLKNFPQHFNRIGVDPATNLVAVAAKNGVTNIPVFFNETTAKNEILAACKGVKPKVIVANNMFAHNKDLKTIVNGVKELLADDGTFIIENSYLLDVLDKALFDLVYHEHIHHHSITALKKFFDSLDMKIYNVERLSNHGGSIRVYICKKAYQVDIDKSVYDLLEAEKVIPTKIKIFKHAVNVLKEKVSSIVDQYKLDNKKIGILGLPAKATTMLYYFGLNNKVDFIYDDNKLKQNMCAPGSAIKISATDQIYVDNPDLLIVLAWNFADDLLKAHQKFTGKFIIPLPQYKEIQ